MTVHTFEALDQFDYVIEAWEPAQKKLAGIFRRRQRLLILTGPLGAGKSSCMASALPTTCDECGWTSIELPVTLLSSNKDLDALDAVLAAKHVRIGADGEDRDAGRNVVQVVEGIANSSNVSTCQQSQSVNVLLGGETQQNNSNEAYLIRLVDEYVQPICFLVDNAHAMLRQADWKESVLASIIKLSHAHPKVACVICVEDTWLGKACGALEEIGIDAPTLCLQEGISITDAQHYCESAVSPLLPNGVTRSIIEQTLNSDGLVSPLHLQALLEVVPEVPTDQPNDVSVGSLDKALSTALRIRVRSLGTSRTGDAMCVLNALALLSERKVSVTVQDVASEIVAIPAEQIGCIVKDLAGLRILVLNVGAIQFAHDGIRQAALYLRNETIRTNFGDQIDHDVTRWFLISSCLSHTTVLDLSRLASNDQLSAPELLALIGSAFELGELADIDGAMRLRGCLGGIAPQYFYSLIRSRVSQSGRGDLLGPVEVFLLLLCHDIGLVKTALSCIFKMVNRSELWSHNAITRALVESKNPLFLKALSNLGPLVEPETVLPLLVGAAFGWEMERPSDAELDQLWSTLKSVVPNEALLIMAMYMPSTLNAMVEEAMGNDAAEVRGTAIQVTVRQRTPGWQDRLIHALQGEDVTVRRKAVIVLPEALEGGMWVDISTLYAAERSPAIREALLDISPDLPLEIRASLIKRGLIDNMDIVRESAVFAACWGLSAEVGLELVRTCLDDPSILVREAILYAHHTWGMAPPPEIIARDGRAGTESLRNAAWRFLKDVNATEVLALTSTVLLNGESRKTERVEALFALRMLRRDDGLPLLDQCLAMSDDIDELTAIVDALEAIGTPQAISRIGVLSHHRAAHIRERAVYALARLGGQDAIHALEKCVYDPDPHVQARAIFGLGRLGEWKYREAIEQVPSRSNNASRAIAWYRFESEARTRLQ